MSTHLTRVHIHTMDPPRLRPNRIVQRVYRTHPFSIFDRRSSITGLCGCGEITISVYATDKRARRNAEADAGEREKRTRVRDRREEETSSKRRTISR